MAGVEEHAASKKSVMEMLGEFCREAGVLVGVFGFLDRFMRDPAPDGQAQVSTFVWACAVSVSCLTLTSIGMIIERKRPQ
jgi:hypothetical protein